MIVKLLVEHHLGFLSLKGGRRGSSESTHGKMPHCWKAHALAHLPLMMPVLDVEGLGSDICSVPDLENIEICCVCYIFPTMWYFDMCRLGRACTTFFQA